jgi:hypothetical protein
MMRTNAIRRCDSLAMLPCNMSSSACRLKTSNISGLTTSSVHDGSMVMMIGMCWSGGADGCRRPKRVALKVGRE